MWVFTKFGFLSAVAKPEDGPNRLTVRARKREHLEAFRREYCPRMDSPMRMPMADYRWHAKVNKKAFARAMSEAALDIDYVNFKDQAKATAGAEFAQRCGQVWNVLYQLQAADERPAERPMPLFARVEPTPETWDPTCPGCGVDLGPACGGMAPTCACDEEDLRGLDPIHWDGDYPGAAECRELEWFAVEVSGRECRCGPEVPGAYPDLDRLSREAAWDRRRRRWVEKGGR
jgi:hypothetical protein